LKRALITGGTGFLGRQLAIRLRDRGLEVWLTGRNHDQNRSAAEVTGCRVLASDVANPFATRDVFAEAKPDLVVHAAASKYVDTAETNPMECIDVNVGGSQNVARAAIDSGAPIVIGISTDKVAPPVSNTYGLTKALMERAFSAMNGKTATKFACVRFGNLPWSTGSVFPIWSRMIAGDGVIKSTGARMTRLFTPLEDAVALVLRAVDEIETVQGSILCRNTKAGLIKDFLDVWTKRKGGTWIEVAPRPGERNYEHLFGEAELPYTTEMSFEGVSHFLITPNRRSADPVGTIVTSETAPRFSEEEIWRIISDAPK
jgi:UDP-N-acetylglucosamine 4,6-dehydratase